MKKSLPVLSGSTPVAEAAVSLTKHHLETMRAHAEELLESEGDSMDAVHQFRVATRRLSATLRIFGSSYPKRAAKELKEKLQKLRRQAGAARFGDVLAIDLAKKLEKSAENSSALAANVLEWVLEERKRARPVLEKKVRRLQKDGFWDWSSRKFSSAEKDKKSKKLGDLAINEIEEPLLRLVEAHALWTVKGTYKSLHRCRVAGKRLRYTLEIFAGCFDPEQFGELDTAMQSLQKILGDVNDSHEFAGALGDLAKTTEDDELARSSGSLAEHYRAELRERTTEFERVWGKKLRVNLADLARDMFETIESGPATETEPSEPPAMSDSKDVIYHLVWKSDWKPSCANGSYRAASLATEGFIHCTKEPEKLIEVTNLFFPYREGDELLVLTLDQPKIAAAVKYEDPGCGHLFPHIYGPLNLDAILATDKLSHDGTGWQLPKSLRQR